MPKIIESNIYSLGNGYYVTIGGGKQYVYQSFTVEKYGNTTKAIEAARTFRDNILKERSTSQEAEEALANALAVNESHQKLNGKLQQRVTELEEDNKKLAHEIEDRVHKMRKSGL